MLPIKTGQYSVKIFHLENGKAPFLDWLKSLDGSTKARISARISRFEDGHFGDHKAVGEGLWEARFFFGSGYRVYFSLHGSDLILLLNGGNKDTQASDIRSAREFLRFYLEDANANKK